jgi:hypothetical protein
MAIEQQKSGVPAQKSGYLSSIWRKFYLAHRHSLSSSPSLKNTDYLAHRHSLLSSPSLKNTETRTNIKELLSFFIYIVGVRECYAVLMEIK